MILILLIVGLWAEHDAISCNRFDEGAPSGTQDSQAASPERYFHVCIHFSFYSHLGITLPILDCMYIDPSIVLQPMDQSRAISQAVRKTVHREHGKDKRHEYSAGAQVQGGF